MYTSYFGFREKPFNVTPDPRFFYTNSVYQEAYATLLYGIRERKGFIVLTGEVGTGKTTLLRRLMDNLEATVRFVFIYNTTMSFDELLSFTCEELGLPVKKKARLRKVQALNEFLIAQLRKGGTGLLLIDEAQNLGEEVLEDLRLLSNLETGSEKLLQILLVGQPELEDKLDQPKLRQLKQRVALHCRLDRLKEQEVGPFIDYRLHVVGYEDTKLFASDAIQRIAFYSTGIPRLINVICDNALLVAYGTSKKKISPKIIEEVAHDLRLKEELAATKAETPTQMPAKKAKEREFEVTGEPVQHKRRRLRGVGVTAFLVLLILGGWGAVVYPLQSKRLLWVLSHKAQDFAGMVGGRLEFLKQNLATSLEVLMPGKFKPEQVQLHLASEPPVDHRPDPKDRNAPNHNNKGEPLALAEQAEHAFPPVLYEKTNSGLEESSSTLDTHTPVEVEQKSSPILVSHQRAEVKQESLSSSGSRTLAKGKVMLETKGVETRGEAPSSLESEPFVPPVSSGWRENPILIEQGTTIYNIVFKAYGDYNPLAIDLIKEYNPHIENLNWVIAGQRLWLPSLSRETLLRQEENERYRLILASLVRLTEARRLQETLERKGYDSSVTARRVSDDLILYRVEITGLKGKKEASQAWDIASANAWIPLLTGLPIKGAPNE